MRHWVVVILASLALAACATTRSQEKQLQETLSQYASVLRWGDVSQTAEFIDPEVRRNRPLPKVELERWHQYTVAGYREQGFETPEPGRARQVVEIEIVNRHTQQQRSFVDVQDWRYDEEAKRWWLVSGAPRIR